MAVTVHSIDIIDAGASIRCEYTDFFPFRVSDVIPVRILHSGFKNLEFRREAVIHVVFIILFNIHMIG